MNLSAKATQFILEALEYRIKAYQDQIETDELDDDTAADVTNDLMYLQSLQQELKKSLGALV
jgi:hypothetical protein